MISGTLTAGAAWELSARRVVAVLEEDDTGVVGVYGEDGTGVDMREVEEDVGLVRFGEDPGVVAFEEDAGVDALLESPRHFRWPKKEYAAGGRIRRRACVRACWEKAAGLEMGLGSVLAEDDVCRFH